jgi:hypothetical protein
LLFPRFFPEERLNSHLQKEKEFFGGAERAQSFCQDTAGFIRNGRLRAFRILLKE